MCLVFVSLAYCVGFSAQIKYYYYYYCSRCVFRCIKTAKVIPILKKGSALDVNNHRPSLLPALSRILEKIMHRRSYSFLTKNNFFYKLRFGFRKKHSTNHAATALIEYICNAFESKEFAIGVFIDLSKAFDTIDHAILLDKLYKYGIRGTAHNWFYSYLHNRTQQVECGGVLSSTKSILSGVPQGSILGPLLFLIYVNSLPTCLNCGQALMFADDTTLLFSSRSYDSSFNMANSNLENVQEWLIANKLSLNVAKTQYIFGCCNHASHVTFLDLLFSPCMLQRLSFSCFFPFLVLSNYTVCYLCILFLC